VFIEIELWRRIAVLLEKDLGTLYTIAEAVYEAEGFHRLGDDRIAIAVTSREIFRSGLAIQATRALNFG